MTKIRNEWDSFLIALAFYTRIPVSTPFKNSNDQARSILYFPVIGWIVGGIGALIFQIGFFFFPQSVALLLSMIGTILLTGALHEDGFADSCDGFGGGWTREEILAIMKDSRLGTFGMLGLALLLALKYVTLLSLDAVQIPLLLVATHSLSRSAAASLLFSHDYARHPEEGKAGILVKRISGGELGIILLLGILPWLIFMDGVYWLIVIPLILLQQFLGHYFKRRLGGYTGDCLGAAQQITEVLCYFFVLALYRAGVVELF